MSIPTHHVGKLPLNTANAELSLSSTEPDLLATNAPRYKPIIVIIRVEVVKRRTVFGTLSSMMSRTSEEPLSLVKKLDLPKSSVITFKTVLVNLLGEYHGSSSPRFF